MDLRTLNTIEPYGMFMYLALRVNKIYYQAVKLSPIYDQSLEIWRVPSLHVSNHL